jgi:hypothetical protein
MNKLRFALLFNGRSLEQWHVRCLDQLEPFANLKGVIVTPDQPRSASKEGGSMLMRWYAKRVHDGSIRDVLGRFADAPKFCFDSLPEPADPAGFDFVLKLGCGSVPTKIRFAARHGLWYFEHEGEGDFLPFFREVYESETVTRAALLALDAPPDDARILEEGCFRTEQRSYIANRDQVLETIAEWPARACRRLSAGAESDSACRNPRGMSVQRRPKNRLQLFRYCIGITRRKLEFAWERLFRHPQWNIGVLNVPVGELLATGAYADDRIEWFPLDGRESFLSDPFGVMRGGRLHVLCEHFGYRESKGQICTIDCSTDGFAQLRKPAITMPAHTSYPFLVENGGEIYCVPETCLANEVALFRAADFPRGWSKVGVLIKQFAGVDPTVFRHDGRWWLMCTQHGPREDSELWIWHASDLLGPWTEHARNPVKTDVRGTRPGGAPFIHNGMLYRPAQDCSKTYGWRIVIQRVTRLTPKEFAEEPVMVLQPSADSQYPLGRHTLTPVDDVVLIDGRRARFVWPALRSFLRICVKDLWSRCGSRSISVSKVVEVAGRESQRFGGDLRAQIPVEDSQARKG